MDVTASPAHPIAGRPRITGWSKVRSRDVPQLRGGSQFMPVHRLDPGHRNSLASPTGTSTQVGGSANIRQAPTSVAKEPLARTGGRGQHRTAIPPRPVRAASRRIPGHAPWADDSPRTDTPEFHSAAPSIPPQRPDRVRSLRRVGIDRQSRRSLVLGGALVVVILGGRRRHQLGCETGRAAACLLGRRR
jgi:hypothetical protein